MFVCRYLIGNSFYSIFYDFSSAFFLKTHNFIPSRVTFSTNGLAMLWFQSFFV